MNRISLQIRPATPNDAAALAAIYAPYVTDTAISFEYTVPTVEEFRRRICKTLEKYPYLVAEGDGEPLGYAYTAPFVGRAAYDWAAETSIYVRRDCRHMGVGRRLYEALEAVSRAQNLLNLNACIGWPETEDAYLTRNSAQFHAHMGYRMVGTFYNCGYKFGRWYHMVWMEKQLDRHPPQPAPVRSFPELAAELPALLAAFSDDARI